MPGPEQKVQTRILQELRKRGVYTVKVMAASRNGVPDILACHQGLFVAIEVKAPGGKLSALQEANLEWISLAGGIALVATSWGDIENYFS